MTLAQFPPTPPPPATRQVSLADAKARLSALVDAVEAGETITITKHGRPAAQLVPVRRDRAAIGAVLDRLMAPSGRTLGPELSLQQLLDLDRADKR